MQLNDEVKKMLVMIGLVAVFYLLVWGLNKIVTRLVQSDQTPTVNLQQPTPVPTTTE